MNRFRFTNPPKSPPGKTPKKRASALVLLPMATLYLAFNSGLTSAIPPLSSPEIELPDKASTLPNQNGSTEHSTETQGAATVSEINRSPSAPFFIKLFGNKCMDAGNPDTRHAGQAVALAECNQSETQTIDIVEQVGTGRVVLKASDYCLGPQGGEIIEGKLRLRTLGAKLELQVCEAGALHQEFAIDGDSIVGFTLPPPAQPVTGPLVLERPVIEAQLGRTTAGTPIVFGARTLDDAEYWTFAPAFPEANYRAKPTSQFVTVHNQTELQNALTAAKYGTVVELGANILLSSDLPTQFEVKSGITIRGGRRNSNPGFRISYPTDFSVHTPVFVVSGDDVRITGLNIIGPSRSHHPNQPDTVGIRINGAASNLKLSSRSIIDHNDLSRFTISAINVTEDHDNAFSDSCLPINRYRTLPARVHIVRNHIHDNFKQGEGYGVEIDGGAHALIQGNTFDNNRHAIEASPDARNEYYAYDNLVMPNSPIQYPYIEVLGQYHRVRARDHLGRIISWYSHDFDVHGSGSGRSYDFEDGIEPPHSNGIAGKSFIISGNTFLGDNRENVDLRGTPCLGASFYGNVTRQNRDDAVTDRSAGNVMLNADNAFGISNPMQTTGVGDFDGDGTLDSFMATGAAWYYRPSGQFEWRFLRKSRIKFDQLELRDIDNDGRTDVSYRSNPYIYASWGAIADDQVIGEIAPPPTTPPPSNGGGGGSQPGKGGGNHRPPIQVQ